MTIHEASRYLFNTLDSHIDWVIEDQRQYFGNIIERSDIEVDYEGWAKFINHIISKYLEDSNTVCIPDDDIDFIHDDHIVNKFYDFYTSDKIKTEN